MLDPSLPHEIQYVYDYLFLEIPIIGRYEFKEKKVSPFVEVGVSPSIYLNTKLKTVTDISTTSEYLRNETPAINNLSMVASVSFGVNYTLNEKLVFFGQTIGRYHFTKLAAAPSNQYLYNFGVEFGIRRNLSNRNSENDSK